MRQFKATVFQALGHPTRIAIVEYLRQGELTVNKLCEKVGVEQANASQHLAILRTKFVVETRKEGNQIHYRLRNPLVGELLETARRYYFAHMSGEMQMLKDVQRQEGEEQEIPS